MPPLFRLLILLAALFLATARAQEPYGSLTGVVVDPAGAVVANARVIVTNPAAGLTRETVSDTQGRFQFPQLPAGAYELRVSVPGFLEKILRGIEVGVAQSASTTVQLQLGSVAETVTVSSNRLRLSPTWSAWAEADSPSPTFTPVANLAPDTSYLLVLDLSAFEYEAATGVYSRPSSERLQQWLKTRTGREAALRVLALPDPGSFEPLAPTARVQPLILNLDRARRVLKGSLRVPDSALEELQRRPDPDWVFGRVWFPLRTTSREGPASVGLSLWTSGNLPIDELSLTFCISASSPAPESCRGPVVAPVALGGVDSLLVSAQSRPSDAAPDAALHFLELDTATAVGVFRRKDWDPSQYLTWPLRRSTTRLQASLQTLLRNFEQVVEEDAMRQVGVELYNLLFPPLEAKEARQAFESFIAAHLGRAESGPRPPSIFVRLLPQGPDPPFLVPLGLMAPGNEFLGFHFRMELPLEVQDYRRGRRCISRWVMLLPPDRSDTPQELKRARDRFAPWIQSWNERQFITDMKQFASWLGQNRRDEEMALMTLSHHADSTLFFEKNRFPVSATAVVKEFRAPSVAILNACGTAGPGALEFVREFNHHGVSAILATSALVTYDLAGDFMNLLARVLEDHKTTPDFTLAQAVFQTVRRLRDVASPRDHVKYGPKALTYTLLGNGNIRLCPPASR